MVTLPMGIAHGVYGVRSEHVSGTRPPKITSLEKRIAINLTKSDIVRSNPDANWFRKPTSYSASIGPVVVMGDVSGTRPNGNWIETAYGRSPFTPLQNPLALSHFTFNDTQALRTKVLINIKDEVLDVAMVLAEMQGTVNTAVTALDRIGRSMQAVLRRKPESFYYLMHGRRRDNRRPTEKFLRETAKEYLHWKYGIMPSVYDLQGATQALDMNTEGSLWNNPPLLVARATVKKESTTKTIDFGNGWTWPYPIPCRVTTEYKARCDYKVTSEGIRGINRYGLGLSTLPTILFERTPFSFVLNMAVPIGELIKAWSALAGCDVAGYCETKYVRVEAESAHLPGNGSTKWQTWSFKGVRPAFSMQRQAYDKPPMPLPFVRNPITTGNLGTVLALFTSLRSSK